MQEEPEKGVFMAVVTVRLTVPSLDFGIHTQQRWELRGLRKVTGMAEPQPGDSFSIHGEQCF